MTTLKVFDVDGTRGLAGLYTIDSSNPDNDAPLVNPYAHLSAVQWHSKFKYPRVVIDQQATVNIPQINYNTLDVRTFDLFAHGRTGGIPMLGPCGILIQRPSGGPIWCHLGAGTPTWGNNTSTGAVTSALNFVQIVSIGANATHVRLQVCTQTRWTAGDPSLFREVARSVTVRAIVTDQYL